MQQSDFYNGLLEYLKNSPTPFHAVANASEMLKAAGFTELREEEQWNTEPDGRYYVIRNGSSLIAFVGSGKNSVEKGWRMMGAHTDSPCLKIKPNPETGKNGYLQLGVEVYGGALLNPWFDRDLSIAGRVFYATPSGELSTALIDMKRAVATIPSLAIHLDREANKNRTVNSQKHLPPLLMQVNDAESVSFRELLRQELAREHPQLAVQKVLDYELCLYDTNEPAVVGLHKEFIASARLDNLLSCYIGLRAVMEADGSAPTVIVLNDHEEVGSVSAEGAQGPFLIDLLRRLGDGQDDLTRSLNRSMMFSIDNAHGIHPNYADRHDEQHGPILNKGPVIKVNANQRYATNSITSGFYRYLSEKLGLPHQIFVVRTDMACGSTIGPISAAQLGVKTLDVGVPQFAMHSIRELAGKEDAFVLFQVLREFFSVESLPVS